MIQVAKKENETEFEWLVGVLAQNFTAIDKRFDHIEGDLGTLKHEVKGIHNRLDVLEGEVKGINGRLDTFVVPFMDDTARRVKDLELIAA